MKYIKKFNEELDASTYRSASKTLSDLKHTKRANRLSKHSDIMNELNRLNGLVKDIKKYSPYGIFDAGYSGSNLNFSKIKEQFALKIWYDDWAFGESFEEYEREYNDYFWIRLSIGLIPILEPGEEEHIRSYYSNISKHVFDDDYIEKLGEIEDTTLNRICDYFGEKHFWGSFSGPSIYVKMTIENGKIVIIGIDVDDDSENTLNILGRKSGMQFKNLLVKLLSSEKFDYPTYNDQNLQQVIKHELCEKSGLSAKYQFAFSEIGEFIKKDSINNYYNTFNFVN